MDINDLLNSDLGKRLINDIGSQTGISKAQTSSVVNAAAPVLMGMLQKNAGSEQGAAGILSALNKHDGSILDNLSGFLGSGDFSDGDGILGHVLGGKRSAVENAISAQTGVSSSKVSTILAMLAPILMGFLGKQTRASGNITDSTGLGGLLGELLGSSGGSSLGGGILSSILDQDGDGQLSVNDAISAISGNKKKRSGSLLGRILGGLFGKK
ncbi:MAG: DUF937 domain-containing protein [Chitinophagales bacterium]|nr:DUF937 domain-containing protein [Chitinophagales bacterium]